MRVANSLRLFTLLVVLSACGRSGEHAGDAPSAADEPPAPAEAPAGPPLEIVPGLTMRVLREGNGATAGNGQIAIVHYTGWLADPEAPDNRGSKFDSSRDRGDHFQFPLGKGRVIAGWDQGVVGMKEGELRELTIAPELAYGDRNVGNGLIPPGSTLIFEVELARVQDVTPEVNLPSAPQ